MKNSFLSFQLMSCIRKNRFSKGLILFVCIEFFALASAHAALLYEQPYIYKSDQNGAISDQGFGQYIADNFVLSSDGSVAYLKWYGYWGAYTVPDDYLNFNIRFYSDDSNKPGTLISNQSVTASGTIIGAVSSSLATGMYELSATLGTPVSLTGGTTYWVSIYENQNNFANFQWATGTSGLSYYSWSSNLSTWGSAASDVFGRQYEAFSLYDSAPSNVPEPGQVAASLLLLAGIGGYVLLKRRRTIALSSAANFKK